MTCKTVFEIKDGYVLCTCEGALDAIALLALTNESLRKSSGLHSCCLLADIRNATAELSMFDAVQFCEHLARMAPPTSRGRTAIVHSEQGEPVSRLFETAMINRSFTVHLFRDFAAAEKWLNNGRR